MALEYLTPGQVDGDGNGKQRVCSPIAAQPGPKQGEKGGGYGERYGAVDFAHVGSLARFERGL